jgi:hypothetical protein
VCFVVLWVEMLAVGSFDNLETNLNREIVKQKMISSDMKMKTFEIG